MMLQLDQLNLIEKTDELPKLAIYNNQVAPLIRNLLVSVGEDPNREGLQRTPERVARMYEELLAGYQTDPAALINEAIFEADYDDIVFVRDIDFFSLCEHHLLPFHGQAHVAYIPDGKILGLSKIPRTVEMFARRLQVQERMTEQIAEFLETTLQPKGVAVMVEAAHMCARMRGIKNHSTRMVTKAMRGIFKTDRQARHELMAVLQGGNPNSLKGA
ncbi:MAG TPA: GTP cyclohydrolase I FolE [Anaerolineae bacterium]|nr:GTP cyclohydrolase I FolE [Anaerolineae bacterium]